MEVARQAASGSASAKPPASRYRCQFSDGNTMVIEKSRRDYSHGWQVTGSYEGTGRAFRECGFARSETLAEKAAASVVRRCGKPRMRHLDINGPLVKGRIIVLSQEVRAVERAAVQP